MKKTLQTLVGVACGIGLFALPSAVQGAEHTLSDFKLGDHVSGEDVKLSGLDGKVVVIDYWGTR